jgi:hypothetical protein
VVWRTVSVMVKRSIRRMIWADDLSTSVRAGSIGMRWCLMRISVDLLRNREWKR